MVADPNKYAGDIRERVRRFLSAPIPSREPVVAIIREIESRGWAGYFFGGFARDLLLSDPPVRPRDIDIVVAIPESSEIERTLSRWIVHRNRFGGFKLSVGQWEVDIWSAKDTWALREYGMLFRSVVDIPRSTFVNVESILVSVAPNASGERAIIEDGFLGAVARKQMDLQFRENPFPALCVIRAIYLSRKLDFAIGRSLGEFLIKRRRDVTLEQVMHAQYLHYGAVRMSAEAVERDWRYIEHKIESGAKEVHLPRSPAQQMLLWDIEH